MHHNPEHAYPLRTPRKADATRRHGKSAPAAPIMGVWLTPVAGSPGSLRGEAELMPGAPAATAQGSRLLGHFM